MTEKPSSYWARCRAEPFRIFFPLATLLGISGVSLWPLFFSGIHKVYPGVMHARMMIEGFMGGFVIGFLATAVPRLLSVPQWRACELWVLVFLQLLTSGLHIGHQHIAGDIAFATLLIFFAGCLIWRFARRAELPPPSFALVGLGYLSGLAGVLLSLTGGQGWIAPEWAIVGNAWLNEAFVFLLVLGVGGFLLPRFLSIEGLRPLDEERTFSPTWVARALFALGVGGVFLVSFWFQFAGVGGKGPLLARLGATGVFLVVMVPIHRARGWRRAVPQGVVVAIAALIIGVALPLTETIHRVAALHMTFLAGFTLITFTVATRVVLGHSGNSRLLEKTLLPLRGATVLLVIGAILRVWGDASLHRVAALNGASYLWMVAAIWWGWAILPKVKQAGAED